MGPHRHGSDRSQVPTPNAERFHQGGWPPDGRIAVPLPMLDSVIPSPRLIPSRRNLPGRFTNFTQEEAVEIILRESVPTSLNSKQITRIMTREGYSKGNKSAKQIRASINNVL